MAITQDYVSWATGNDYKGASFTDGAYTSATKTLTKAGAFAATKVNHWLYLESNDGGSIVAGYYRVTDVTGAPNAVVLATDAGAGVDDDAAKCTQHDGSTTLPWRSDQGACDLLTRNATDGNQVNIKSGSAVVHAAALDLTTFIAGSALGVTKPLIIRGYTATANDGGIGEIDCGGATMFAAETYDYVILRNLDLHTFGDNAGIALDISCSLIDCEVSKGASSPSAKILVNLTGAACRVTGCYLHGDGAGAGKTLQIASDCLIFGNYIVKDAANTSSAIYGASSNKITGNIIYLTNVGQNGILVTYTSTVSGNIVYNATAGTNRGIIISPSAIESVCINNIVCGQSGAGGDGVEASNIGLIGYNAFWNNTNPNTITDQKFIDLTAHDVILVADPFTDAANGDFSLTAAAKTALAAKGWPTSYLGAHANTVPNLNIGPIQMAAGSGSGGGRPAFGDRTGGKF